MKTAISRKLLGLELRQGILLYSVLLCSRFLSKPILPSASRCERSHSSVSNQIAACNDSPFNDSHCEDHLPGIPGHYGILQTLFLRLDEVS